MVPFYIRYMGIEAYGLVGFYAMLHVWFQLLDMGLTPTIARETARFHAGAMDPLRYRRLVRALEGVFLALALSGAGAMFASAGYIAGGWLKTTKIPISEVETAVELLHKTLAADEAAKAAEAAKAKKAARRKKKAAEGKKK